MYNFAQNRKQTDPEKIEFINGFVVKLGLVVTKILMDSIKVVGFFLFIDGSHKQNIYFILTLIKNWVGIGKF